MEEVKKKRRKRIPFPLIALLVAGAVILIAAAIEGNPIYLDEDNHTAFIEWVNGTGIYINGQNDTYITKNNKTEYADLYANSTIVQSVVSQWANRSSINFTRNGSVVVYLDPPIKKIVYEENKEESLTRDGVTVKAYNERCTGRVCAIRVSVCTDEVTTRASYELGFYSSTVEPLLIQVAIPRTRVHEYLVAGEPIYSNKNKTWVNQYVTDYYYEQYTEWFTPTNYVYEWSNNQSIVLNLPADTCYYGRVFVNNIIGIEHKFDWGILDPFINASRYEIGNVTNSSNHWGTDINSSTSNIVLDVNNDTFTLGGGSSTLDQDLILQYTFDDADLTGGNPDDVTGNGFDGTSVNTPTTSKLGVIGEAFQYTQASSEYVQSDWPLFGATSQPRTWGFWLNTSGWNGLTGEHSFVYSDTDGTLEVQHYHPTMYWQWRLAADAGWASISTAQNGFSGWVCIVGQWNGSLMRLFVDGDHKANASTSLGRRGAWADMHRIGAGFSTYSNMQSDIFTVWNRSISYDEVIEFCDETQYPFGSGYNASQNTYNSTKINMTASNRITPTYNYTGTGSIELNVSCDGGTTWNESLSSGVEYGCKNGTELMYNIHLIGNATDAPIMQNLTIDIDQFHYVAPTPRKFAQFLIVDDDDNTLHYVNHTTGHSYTSGFSLLSVPYGEMYIHDDTGANTTISDTVTYFTVSGFTEGYTNNMTYTSNTLNVVKPGMYKVNWHLSFGGGANDIYEVTIKVNGTATENCEAHRKLGAGGDEGSSAGTCILDLGRGATVQLGIQDATTTADAEVFGANVNIMRVGHNT